MIIITCVVGFFVGFIGGNYNWSIIKTLAVSLSITAVLNIIRYVIQS